MFSNHQWEWDDIPQWPFKAQMMVLICFLLGVQILAWILYFSPKWNEWEMSQQREDALKQQIQFTINQLAELDQKNTYLAALLDEYQAFLALLPKTKELAKIVSSINELGGKYQLSITRIHWGKEQVVGKVKQLPLHIELQGEYNQIGAFVEAIASLPQLIYFPQVEWRRMGQDSDRIAFIVTAYTHQILTQPKDTLR